MIATSIVLVLFYFQADVSQADDYEYRLVKDLMRTYDPRIRPSRNSSQALNVTFGLALAQVIDVDEKNQIITTNCWINQAWIDPKLRWDPAKYDGIKVVRLPFDSLWRPDILLYNNADITSYKSSISSNVIVSSDGNVTWLSMTIFRSSCPIDVRYFPFDEQNCSMQFASWTYDGFQVNLEKVGDDGDVSNYIQNSEWDLVKLHVRRNVVYYSCCAEPYPDVTYKIQLRRRPLFYVFNLLFPCFLLTLVALLGFYIPSQSGEKVTMGITTLLSMTVFLMLVAESMPPTSEGLPLIGLYFGINIVIVSLATALTVITLNIHNQGHMGQRVPPYVRRICFGLLAKVLCVTIEPPEYPYANGNSDCESTNGDISSLRREKTTARRCSDNLYRCHQLFSAFESDRELHRLLEISEGRQVVRPKSHANGVQRKPSNSNTNEIRLHAATANNNTKLMDDSESSAVLDSDVMHSRVCKQQQRSPSFLPPPPPPPSLLHHAVRDANEASADGVPSDKCQRQFLKLIHKVYETVERNEIRLEQLNEKETMKLEWNLVALIVDRLFLWMFLIITFSVTFGIIFSSPHAHEFIFKTRSLAAASKANTSTT